MDLKRYIESEAEEEKALGYSPSGAAAATGSDGYPGDPDVHVPETDVVAERLVLPTPTGQQVYLARPAGGEDAPAVLVIHENKGLVPYIEDVARRLAKQGYVAIAPDLLSRAGGTASFGAPGDATRALAEIPAEVIVSDLRAVVSEVARLEHVTSDRVGVVGFCFGGGVAWRLLTQEPALGAGVPFYGPIPDLDDVAGIQAPVLGIYGELDERITSMLPDIEAAMAQHGKTFESMVLPGAQHAFHNDTNPDRYDPDAARQAWDKTVGWLDRWLKRPGGRDR